MAQPPHQEAVTKELVAVVGKIKKVEGTVTQGAMVVSEDLLMIMSEIKSILKQSSTWYMPPVLPSDLIVRNSTEYAVIVKLRSDAATVSDALASKLVKKVKHT
jgi:hypothetical protein